MAAARRRTAGRRGGGTPSWMWLMSGVLVGLGLAYYLWSKGYIPQPEVDSSGSGEATQNAPGDADEVAPITGEPKKSPYDFFTVLPEMEVVVPEQELSEKSKPQATTPQAPADNSSYMLQVGSFRQSQDAEQMKARLALQGITAGIQTVTVNDATWHRVRVGPVSGARQAEDMRNKLSSAGIDSLVMKNQ